MGIDENFNFPLVGDEDQKLLRVTYEHPNVIDAKDGIEEGAVLGEAVLRYNGKPVARVPLVARENIDGGFSIGSFFVTLVSPLLAA